MEYLKLGENASVFFDPSTHLLIRSKEVIAVERLPKSKKFGLARRNGHVTVATEAEYNKFIGKLDDSEKEKFAPKAAPKKGKGKKSEDDYDYNPELLTLTPDEFRERVIDEGFLEEDIVKFNELTDIKQMIRLFDEINKSYQ